MGLFDFGKSKKEKTFSVSDNASKKSIIPKKIKDSPDCFADSSTVAPDERAFYQPDNYYTYYTYPGTGQGNRITTFDERKNKSFPSARGLYVAEILLLDYCNQGKYPKPKGGYPGFWWFEYGIRDVGHALESLAERGFLRWGSKKNSLKDLKVQDLKDILINNNLPANGKKDELIERIANEIPDEKIEIKDYIPKYELTELGYSELEDNGYVPYMHKHKSKTVEGNTFGEPFNVWSVNKLFKDGNATDWKRVVGQIEQKRFGLNMVEAAVKEKKKTDEKTGNKDFNKEDIRDYLSSKKDEIDRRINTSGDGFDEESKGIKLKSLGKDKEALVEFYVSIGKRFDAPALYREAAIILRKYEMYEEELQVIDSGIQNVAQNNQASLIERREKLLSIMSKKKQENDKLSSDDFDTIMRQITSGLTGDTDKDLSYLKSMCEKYKNHEMAQEILRACGRLIYNAIPEDKKQEMNKAISNDKAGTDAAIEEIRFNIYKKNYDKALEMTEALVNKIENSNLYQDDRVSEYHDFQEFFEEILYRHIYKPQKDIRNAPVFPFVEIYYLYGSLLVEMKRPIEAREALKKGLQWNPMCFKMLSEYIETYKMEGDMENFYDNTIEAFRIAFRSADVARCFRNIGYYFVEKKLYSEAKAAYFLSMSYDNQSGQAQSELYYISQMAGNIPDPGINEAKKYSEKYGFPLGVDENILKIAYSYFYKFKEIGQMDGAEYCGSIIYDLTHDEEIKKMLDSLH